MIGDLWLVGHVWRSGLMFVVDAAEDVLGVTRLHHVALTGFFWGWFWGVILTFVVDAIEDVLGVTLFFLGGEFWGVILTFVVDATEDVLGVTRLHHVALTGFWGVCGSMVAKPGESRSEFSSSQTKVGGAISERLMQYIWAYVWRSNLDVQVNMPWALGEIC